MKNILVKKILLLFLLVMLFAGRVSAQYISYVGDFDLTNLKPYNGSPLAVGSEEGVPEGITFNSNGSKMYIVGQSGDEVNQYSLATPFNTNSGVTHDGFYSVAAQYTNPRIYGIAFSNDGLKMFIIGTAGSELTQYNLTTPFDITSGVTFNTSYDFLGSGFSSPTFIVFNDNGTKMYVKEGAGVTQFSLSIAFDITSTIVEEGTYSLGYSSEGMVFTADGSKMLVVEKANDLIHEYSLTTPYVITAGVVDNSVTFDLSNEETFPSALAISNDNSSLFVVGQRSGFQQVLQYDMSIPGFTEAAANDGTLDGSVTITIDGDTFTSQGGALSFGGDYTIANLPAGLTPTISVASGGQSATLSLSGTANSNQNYNDVYALTIAFANSALTGNNASNVYNSEGSIATPGVDFDDNTRLTYGNAFDLSKGVNLEQEASILTGSTDPAGVAYSPDGSLMYIPDVSGEIFQYQLSEFFDPSTATLLGSVDVNATYSRRPTSLIFNPDGTKMYFVALGRVQLYEFSVATPFDITSGIASLGTINVVGMDSSPEGMTFNNDGTKLFVIGSSNDAVLQYNLTVPYDFSTGVTNSMNSFDVSAQDVNPREVLFSPGGSKMFVLGGTSDAIHQYSLSVPFDLSSTVSYAGITSSLAIPGGSPNATGMTFNTDGSEISVVIRDGFPNRVNTYSIAQGSFDEIINDGSVSGESVINIFGDTFVNAGTTLQSSTHYTIDNLPGGLNPQVDVAIDGSSASLSFSGKATNHQNVNDISSLMFTFTDAAFTSSVAAEVQNSTAFSSGVGINFRDNNPSVVYGENFNPSVAFYTGKSLDISSSNAAPTAFAFNADGSRVYVLGDTNDEITQLDLTIPFEISSGALATGTFSVTDEETSPNDIVFNTDGSKMFIVGTSDEVNQYTLANPFDISTGVTFDGSPLDVSNEDTQSIGLTFSPDGLKLYMLGTASDDINQYSLTNAFDITSGVSFDGNPFGIGAQESNPRSLAFSADGFKLFVVGNVGDDVNQYNLTVPFDITKEVVFEGSPFFLGGQDDAILDIAFDNTGKRMYAMGISNNKIYQYEHTGGTLLESPNDGTIAGSFKIFLIDEVFTNAGGTLNPANYSISNLPAGLTPSFAVSVDGLSATLTFADKAISHQNANDVASLQFSFGNAAFAGNDASAVSNSTTTDSGLGINFLDNNPQLIYGDGYNLSSAMASGTLDLSGEGVYPLEIKFSADGTKLYVLEEDDSEINQYALTTPYDISAGVTFETNTTVFNSEDTSPLAFSFNNDGSKLFILGGNSGQMYQYTLSNAFDITSGVSHDGSPLAIAVPDPSGLAFSPDGTSMFISQINNNPGFIHQYTLNIAFDITAGVESAVPQISVGSIEPEGVSFSEDGRSMFIIKNDEGNKVIEYLLVAAFDPAAGISAGGELSLTGGGESGFRSPVFSSDGSELFLLNGNSLEQYSIDLGGFTETAANAGEVEGELSIRIIDDLFASAGSNLPFSDYEITNLPVGLSLNISVAADGASAMLLLTGSAIDNSNAADIASLQFNFTDAAFVNSSALEVENARFAESNIGIDFIEEPIIEDQTLEIAENSADDTTVGVITATDPEGGSLTFAPLTGEIGSLFNLNPDGTLIVTRGINFEEEGPYQFDVTVTSDAPNNFSSTATITVEVLDVNEEPIGIQLSAFNIDESNAIGTAIGTLTSTDQDIGQTHTYSLVTGTGDTDNTSFSIAGDQLVSAEVFDFEMKTDYSVRIQTSDGNGGTYEESFAISVNDLPASVTSIDLDNYSVAENEAIGTLVGSLMTSGEDLSGTFTYDLVNGTGDDDNESFSLLVDQISTTESFNYEVKNTYSIRVSTDDGNGHTLEEVLTITVDDVLESTDANIVTFVLDEQTGDAIIDDVNNTVSIEVAYGTDLSNLSPIITITPGASISPDGAQDFTLPVTYTVIAEEPTSVEDWVVTVTEAPSNETDILTFVLAEQTGSATINPTSHTVSIEVENGTDVSGLTPTITISDGASISLSGTQDFSSEVIYLVTAEDGSTAQNWVVTVTEAPSVETDILAFELAEQTGLATIDATNHAINIEVENGTDVTDLTPTITLSAGASISLSGAQDFSSAVTYTVTAEDGSTTQDWLVTVTEEPAALSNETDILTFVLAEQTGSAIIDDTNHTVSIEVESGSDVTDLTPAITLSAGASVSPSGAQDFSSAVTYTVTAEDGATTQDWVVTVTESIVSSVDDQMAQVQFYPNPATEWIQIEGLKSDQAEVQIFDTRGMTVMAKTLTSQDRLSISRLQTGMYIMKITDSKITTTTKLIIRR